MTATDTDAAPSAVADADLDQPAVSGLAGLLGSSDHRVVGRMWMITGLLYLLGSGVTGVLIGVERVDTNSLGDVLGGEVFAQVFSMHAVAGLFLFLIPTLIGLALYLTPLQVGSPSVAFGRAAAGAYWAFLISGAIVVASYLADGGPFGSDPRAVELFIAAMVVLLGALCLGWICVAATVITLRRPGMSLLRTPLFSWSALVSASVWLLTLPVLAATLVLVYVDHRYGQTFLGGSSGVYIRIAWAFGIPAVYAAAIPVLGIVGDVVGGVTSTRFAQHRVALVAVGAFGALSVGAWAQGSFSPTGDLDVVFRDEIPYVAFALGAVLPVLVIAGLVGQTIARGTLKIASPLLYSVGALLLLLAATVNGAVASIYFWGPLEDLAGTTADTSQAHFVYLAVLAALFGAVSFWAPQIWGRGLAEGPNLALAAGVVAGSVLLAAPDLVSGFLDQVRLVGPGDSDRGTIEVLNLASAVGGGLLVLAAVGFVSLILRTLAGDDDQAVGWTGNTLEWADGPVAVTSEAPAYDARHGREGGS